MCFGWAKKPLEKSNQSQRHFEKYPFLYRASIIIVWYRKGFTFYSYFLKFILCQTTLHFFHLDSPSLLVLPLDDDVHLGVGIGVLVAAAAAVAALSARLLLLLVLIVAYGLEPLVEDPHLHPRASTEVGLCVCQPSCLVLGKQVSDRLWYLP